MDQERTPSFWSIIPDTVMSDRNLKPNAKLLYARITSLQSANGYCYATNKYLAEQLCVEPDTITRLLNNLSKAGYISVDVVRDEQTKEILQRRIFTTIRLPSFAQPPGQKSDTPPGQKSDTPPGQKSGENKKDSNIPPIVPQGDDGSRDHNQTSLPRHKPERFEGFWKFYPRHEDRKSAVKAWDKLKPSEELIDQIAYALARQKHSPQWQDKTKVPYACRYLKNERWNDIPAELPVQTAATRGEELEEW